MPPTSSQNLIDRLRARTARLGVIGLGYVGLPLAVEFARAGFATVGFDVDEENLTRLRRGLVGALTTLDSKSAPAIRRRATAVAH